MNKLVGILLLIMSHTAYSQQIVLSKNAKYIALGDSYTIGESVQANERWPVQLAAAFREKGLDVADPLIIARTGWRTDDLKAAIQQNNPAHDYTLVSLLIGVNNQYQGKPVSGYKPEFEGLVDIAITLAGGDHTRVFVVSIPDYGYTPFGKSNQPAISEAIDAYNAVNKAVCEARGITYFNITPISRRGLNEPDLVAGDGLHPSGKMYSEWVDLMLPGFTIVPGDITTQTEKENYKADIRVYPNPVKNDELIIKNLPQPGNYSLQLNDAQGKEALRQPLTANGVIDMHTLASGTYIYQIFSGDKLMQQGKILKQ